MAATMSTQFQIEKTIQAAMRCGSIDADVVRGFYALSAPVARALMQAVADLVEDNDLNAKNLTLVAKLFNCGFEVALRKVGTA